MRGGRGVGPPLALFAALAVVGVIAAAILILRPWPFSTDTAKYGRLALPNTPADALTTPLDESTAVNEATLELEEGTVTVFYARLRGGRETLNQTYSPERFGLRVVPAAGGEPLEIEDRRVTVGSNEGLTETVTIGELDVPETGDYLVSASARTAADTGHITFGDEKLAATATRAKDVLLTPWAAAYLALLVLTGFIAVRRFRRSPRAAWLGGALAGAGGGARGGEPAAGTAAPTAAATPEQMAAFEASAREAQLAHIQDQVDKGEITEEQAESARSAILGDPPE